MTVAPPRPLGSMRLPLEKATLVLSLLVEGSSIRSTERVTGVHRDTICRLPGAGRLQADEIWDFVQMKDKEKLARLRRPHIGSAWTFTTIDRARICTSQVERQNLTMHMGMGRFTRLTNGFSKKWENLRAALALHFAHYNFCRMHSSIRRTPARTAGFTNRAVEPDGSNRGVTAGLPSSPGAA